MATLMVEELLNFFLLIVCEACDASRLADLHSSLSGGIRCPPAAFKVWRHADLHHAISCHSPTSK